jgi:DNA-binding Lrp family transcriptional regulator
VKKLPQVMECYHVSGLHDYLLKVVVEDMKAYQLFITNELASLSNIGRVQSSFVMTVVKDEHILQLN